MLSHLGIIFSGHVSYSEMLYHSPFGAHQDQTVHIGSCCRIFYFQYLLESKTLVTTKKDGFYHVLYSGFASIETS